MAADAPLTTNHTENERKSAFDFVLPNDIGHASASGNISSVSRLVAALTILFRFTPRSALLLRFIPFSAWNGNWAENRMIRMYFRVSARHAPTNGPLQPKHTNSENALCCKVMTRTHLYYTHTHTTSTSLGSAVWLEKRKMYFRHYRSKWVNIRPPLPALQPRRADARAPISSTTQMHVHFMRNIARALFSVIIFIYGYIRFSFFFPRNFERAFVDRGAQHLFNMAHVVCCCLCMSVVSVLRRKWQPLRAIAKHKTHSHLHANARR